MRCQGGLAAVASLPVATSDFSAGRRVAFRFAFLYVVLYVFPFPIGNLPGTTWPGERYQDLWNAILPWIGKRVFRLDEVPIQPTGSGDTAAAYLQIACVVALAALGTAVWSWIRRLRPGDDRALMPWLLVYLRYWLAATLITYGAVKILKSQFPFPTPERLLSPFGQMSPMGLLWRFMGYSTAYTVFTGLTEAIGGALLFFRRTTTLGALVIAGVMANVVMLNLSYDVPVKLYSSHLLLAAIFLLLPDLRRLANVLVLNRPAAAAGPSPPDLFTRFGRARLALKIAAVALMVGDTFHMAWSSYTKWGGGAPRHALYGAYEVESFERNGVTVPPLLTEATRWRRVAVSNSRWFAMLMDDTRRAYWLADYDAGAGKLTLGSDEEKKEVLSLTRPDEGHLLLEGTLGEDRLVVRLRKIDMESFGLVNRGFRWVSEEPFHPDDPRAGAHGGVAPAVPRARSIAARSSFSRSPRMAPGNVAATSPSRPMTYVMGSTRPTKASRSAGLPHVTWFARYSGWCVNHSVTASRCFASSS